MKIKTETISQAAMRELIEAMNLSDEERAAIISIEEYRISHFRLVVSAKHGLSKGAQHSLKERVLNACKDHNGEEFFGLTIPVVFEDRFVANSERARSELRNQLDDD